MPSQGMSPVTPQSAEQQTWRVFGCLKANKFSLHHPCCVANSKARDYVYMCECLLIFCFAVSRCLYQLGELFFLESQMQQKV